MRGLPVGNGVGAIHWPSPKALPGVPREVMPVEIPPAAKRAKTVYEPWAEEGGGAGHGFCPAGRNQWCREYPLIKGMSHGKRYNTHCPDRSGSSPQEVMTGHTGWPSPPMAGYGHLGGWAGLGGWGKGRIPEGHRDPVGSVAFSPIARYRHPDRGTTLCGCGNARVPKGHQEGGIGRGLLPRWPDTGVSFV
ncbi:hypothetical protein [Thermogutta sp.]|uniref:hypothetical protein n=1 Tax=Thermogutta sp. TaxID=1962930 RepID=UPI00321F7F25